MKPERADDWRGARLEPRRRRGEGRAREAYLIDHRAAALPGGHRVQYLGPRPQYADAGRAVKLMSRKHIEIAAERFHIQLHARRRLTAVRSEEHTSELQSLMRISYAVFCLKKKKKFNTNLAQIQLTSQIKETQI